MEGEDPFGLFSSSATILDAIKICYLEVKFNSREIWIIIRRTLNLVSSAIT